MKKYQKILLAVALVFILLTIPWQMFINHYHDTKSIKTTATVVRFNRVHKQQYPVLEYTDLQGQVHTTRGIEGFYGLAYIYAPKIGDKFTAFYDKSDPAKSDISYGLWDNVPWYPTFLGAFLLLIFVSVFVGKIIKKKTALGKA